MKYSPARLVIVAILIAAMFSVGMPQASAHSYNAYDSSTTVYSTSGYAACTLSSQRVINGWGGADYGATGDVSGCSTVKVRISAIVNGSWVTLHNVTEYDGYVVKGFYSNIDDYHTYHTGVSWVGGTCFLSTTCN